MLNIKKIGIPIFSAMLLMLFFDSFSYASTEAAVAEKVNISEVVISDIPESKTYTGKAITLSPLLTYKDEALTKGVDYSLSYKSNKNIGMAKIIISGKGNYTGTLEMQFQIIPKGTTLKKVESGEESITVKWNKRASGITGYQIQYASDEGFSQNMETVTINNPKSTSKTISPMEPDKLYFVHIRTFKKKKEKTYYSGWSEAKDVSASEAPFRSMYNPTGYEEAPLAPSEIKVGSRYAGYDERWIDTKFGDVKRTTLWYKESSKGKKHEVAILQDSEEDDGETVVASTRYSLGATNGKEFYYMEEKRHDEAPMLINIMRVNDEGKQDIIYSRYFNKGDGSFDSYAIVGFYKDCLLLSHDYSIYKLDNEGYIENEENHSEVLSLNVKTKALIVLDQTLNDE